MMISRYTNTPVLATFVALALLGSNVAAGSDAYVFQYEYGIGGKHPTRNLYLAWQPRFVSDADVFNSSELIQIPLYSTEPKMWTLFRAVDEDGGGTATCSGAGCFGNVMMGVFVVGGALYGVYKQVDEAFDWDFDYEIPKIEIPENLQTPPPQPTQSNQSTQSAQPVPRAQLASHVGR